jgi:hypothetical protein
VRPLDFRFELKADMPTLNWGIRCYPNTGHAPRNSDKSPEDDRLTVRL